MDISKSYSDMRQFGPNRGIPMLHLEINDNKRDTADLLKSIVDRSEILEWVYIKGDNFRGLGGFLKALILDFKLKVEVELKTLETTPGWINSVNNVLIPYKAESKFNYFSLKQDKDFIIFKAETSKDLEDLVPIFYDLRFSPATKWLLVSEDIYWSAYDLVIKYPRCRMSIKEGNHYVRRNSEALEVSSQGVS